MFLCLSRAGWVSPGSSWRTFLIPLKQTVWRDVELWGGIGGDGGQAEAMDPWRKRGSNCEQTRRQSPQAHHPTTAPTARCNSTPEITITPWALSVPLLAHFPFAPGSLRRGATLSHQCRAVWRPCIAQLELLTDSHIYTVFVLKPFCRGHVRS